MQNKSIYIIALMVFLLSSCGKDYDVETVDTQISEPQELPSTRISGQTSDLKGEIIPNAKVHYYHENEWHIIETDAQGNYSFELPQNDEKTYLHATADGFVNSSLKSVSRTQQARTTNIILPTLEQLPTSQLNDLPNVENTLATVSGQAFAANGDPLLEGVVVLINPDSFSIEAFAGIDSEGFFSFTSEPFEDLALFTFRQCGGAEVITEMFSLGTEDIDLGTITTSYVINPSFTFNGFITDCNTGLGLTTGLVSISLENGITTNTEIIDGSYELTIEACNPADCYDLRISSGLYVGPPTEFECLPLDNNIITNDYEFCGEESPTFSGNISINIDNQTFDFPEVALEQVTTGEWQVSGVNVGSDTTFVFFEIEGLASGTYPVTNFVITSSSFLYFKDVTDVVTSTFTYENNQLEGVVSGNLYDVSTTQSLPFDGTFNITEE